MYIITANQLKKTDFPWNFLDFFFLSKGGDNTQL